MFSHEYQINQGIDSNLLKKSDVHQSTDAKSKRTFECAIDEDVVECSEMDSPPYTGIPAPILTPVDDWFASPYGCPSAINKIIWYKKQRSFKQEAENRKYWTKESDNIHQEMYDLATKSGATTTST